LGYLLQQRLEELVQCVVGIADTKDCLLCNAHKDFAELHTDVRLSCARWTLRAHTPRVRWQPWHIEDVLLHFSAATTMLSRNTGLLMLSRRGVSKMLRARTRKSISFTWTKLTSKLLYF
jgi:hypothetical protein